MDRCFDFSAGYEGGALGYNHPRWRARLRQSLSHLQAPRHVSGPHPLLAQLAGAFCRRNGFPARASAFPCEQLPPSLEVVEELDLFFHEAPRGSVLRLGVGLDGLSQLPAAARSFKHFWLTPRFLPKGLIPGILISLDPGELGALASQAGAPGEGHPLLHLQREFSVLVHRPSRERNCAKLAGLLEAWVKALPQGVRAECCGHTALLDIPEKALARWEARAGFTGRLFFRRLSFCLHRGRAVLLPPVDETLDHYQHRLRELDSVLRS